MTRTEVARRLGLTYKEVKDAELSGLDKCRRYLLHYGYGWEDFFGPPEQTLGTDFDPELLCSEEPDDDLCRPADVALADGLH
jgi:hypothetical protein